MYATLISDGLDSSLEQRFARLAAMQGTDPGLFVLAVHSFVEGYLRERIELDDPEDDRFSSYLYELKCRLEKKAYPTDARNFEVLSLLSRSHVSTNDVRHRFAPLAVEEARQATYHLAKFCALVGIDGSEGIAKVKEYLSAWDERRPLAELTQSLAEAGFKLQLEKNKARQLTERVSQLESLEGEFAKQKESRRLLDARIAELERLAMQRDDKVDELRAERGTLMNELRATKKKLGEFKDARDYLEILSKMTVYTRTRLDYERSITRLTQEQKKVLERISLNEDFLVKGSAGTGKTLVLLKAMEKAKSGQLGQWGLDIPDILGSVALLTYTNTLVRYDQYIAALLSDSAAGIRVSTADAFLLERLKEFDPSSSIDYSLPEELAKQFPAAGLSPKELAAEIEGFLWGNIVTYDEYIIEGIDRRGMKRPLMKAQRNAVWSSAEAMEAAMTAGKAYTRNYAALMLAQAVAENRASGIVRTDFIFIDEAQDLPAAVLKALKACANRCVILAGDADQSIYQPGFSFKRATLDIAGRTRILRINFRNTVQLHELAERYRKSGPAGDSENQPEAFRDGPAPELFEAANLEGMLDMLKRRISLFLNMLGYAPENICVVVPRDEDMQTVRSRLSDEGLSLVDIRDRGFDFREAGSVRLTTMHSAKGLDFPVVLLFLPSFHVTNSSFDQATSERMARNLIYVAMTRAMDHLNIFLKEGTDNPALVDLARCFDESAAVSAGLQEPT